MHYNLPLWYTSHMNDACVQSPCMRAIISRRRAKIVVIAASPAARRDVVLRLLEKQLGPVLYLASKNGEYPQVITRMLLNHALTVAPPDWARADLDAYWRAHPDEGEPAA
jgi:hypothetical protein